MTAHRPGATINDLLFAIEAVTEQIKVLVSAVDDLRCEVEWQSRNIANAQYLPAQGSAAQEQHWLPDPTRMMAYSAEAGVTDNSLLSALGRLRSYEKVLLQAPRGLWLDQWDEIDEVDALELPVGRVFSISADMWDAILSMRPVHVVSEGCDCEEDTGAPFLLAWRTETEYLIRELSDEEAHRIQELCLTAQAEQADTVIRKSREVQNQRDLF